MQIEPIDCDTIKIVLEQADLELFDLTYESMDYHDPATRRALLNFLQEAQLQTGIQLAGCKLLVEAFPAPEQGCILYVNRVECANLTSQIETVFPSYKNTPCTSSFDTPLAFQLDGIQNLTNLCSHLCSADGHLILKSSLFCNEQNQYYLLLYSYCRMEQRLILAAKEFGTYLGKGTIFASVIREHYRELIPERAIETITQYLG